MEDFAPKKISFYNYSVTEFKCVGIDEIEVRAGKYLAYHVIGKNVELWYADAIKNVVKIAIQNVRIGKAKTDIYMELTDYHIKNVNPPQINITRPRKGYLYIFDREIIELGETIVIGDITINAGGSQNITKVEFYLDDKLYFVDYEIPYQWKCNETSFGLKEIKCIAYDIYGNKAEDTLKMIYIHR